MSAGTALVGILVGWASATWPGSAGSVSPVVTRVAGIVGGLVGVWLTVQFGSNPPDPVAIAIWAWAGSRIVVDLVGLTMGPKA